MSEKKHFTYFSRELNEEEKRCLSMFCKWIISSWFDGTLPYPNKGLCVNYAYWARRFASKNFRLPPLGKYLQFMFKKTYPFGNYACDDLYDEDYHFNKERIDFIKAWAAEFD